MAASFSISPMSQNLELEPGQVFTGSITVSVPADASSDFKFKAALVPYNVVGENYEIDTSSVQTFSEIVNWTSLSETAGTIAPNESQKVNFTITVPENAPGGAQSMALHIIEDSEASSDNTVGISSAFSMGSIIYANIAGETTTGGQILSNYVPAFTTSTPVTATAKVENTGNVYEAASVTITVTNSITGEEILSSESEGGNHFSEIILPKSTRLISRQIDNLPTIGIVHIDQSVLFEGQTSTTSHELFICPVWFMALVILVITAIVGSIVFFIKRRKRKMII